MKKGMRKFLLAAVMVLSGVPALAEDEVSWSGFYIGGQAGGGGASIRYNGEAATARLHDCSAVAGPQAGFNYHCWRMVAGGEIAFIQAKFAKERPNFFQTSERSEKLKAEISTVALGTGRLCFLVTPCHLVYVKGGYGGARLKAKRKITTEPFTETRQSSSQWHHGWAYGGGVEYMRSPRMTVGLEYINLEFSKKRHIGAEVDPHVYMILLRLNFLIRTPGSGL